LDFAVPGQPVCSIYLDIYNLAKEIRIFARRTA
jgi:hypothetical protein